VEEKRMHTGGVGKPKANGYLEGLDIEDIQYQNET
jgi:hypothetical protein